MEEIDLALQTQNEKSDNWEIDMGLGSSSSSLLHADFSLDNIEYQYYARSWYMVVRNDATLLEFENCPCFNLYKLFI